MAGKNIALGLHSFILTLDLSFISFMALAKLTDLSEPEQQKGIDISLGTYVSLRTIVRIK